LAKNPVGSPSLIHYSSQLIYSLTKYPLVLVAGFFLIVPVFGSIESYLIVLLSFVIGLVAEYYLMKYYNVGKGDRCRLGVLSSWFVE
jgi:hypothetical protein